jgi:fatty-acyl-CoA synthase
MNGASYPPLGKLSVGNVLRTAAVRHGQREALLCAGTGRRFSFQQIHWRSNQLANGLIALGLEPGSVVAFICSNRVEILDIYASLAKSGMVGLPLNYRLAPAEISSLVNAMHATTLICEARFGSVLEHLRTHSPGIRRYIWIGPDVPRGYLSYQELLTTAASSEPDIEIDEHAPYYFNLTSGTTGLPKSYVLTQHSACSLHAAVLAQDARPEDVNLTVFPAFGRVGLGSLLMSIVMGARNVLANFEPAETLRLIHQESVTFLWLVPTMAALLLNVETLDSEKLRSLRGIGFVGAMLTRAIRDRTTARLCSRIYEGYGLQEMGMLTVSTPEDRVGKPDSVGAPILFSEVRIVDDRGQMQPPGTIGEIVGRSPNGIRAYYQSLAKNAEVFRNGWFHTGDLGRLDEDGYLYLCGRVKDLIITGGQNVFAAEVEAALLDLPNIEDCAVIGLPHEIWGEVVTAVIVLSPGAAQDAQRVREQSQQHLASFKVPRLVAFQQDPLPRTPTGKVQKFLLIEQYGSLALTLERSPR